MIEEILKTKQISDPHSLTKFKDGLKFLTNNYRLYSPISLANIALHSYGVIIKNNKYYSLHLCKHNKYCICRVDKIAGCHLCKMEKTQSTKKEIYGDPNYNNRIQFKKTNLERFGYESYNQQPSRKAEIKIEQNKLSKKTVLKVLKEQNFQLKGKWKGWTGKHSLKCLKCNHIIRRTPSMLSRLNCPICNPVQSSQFEKDVHQYIKSIYDGKIEVNKRFGHSEIDIFLPELNLGFECNGNYWHNDTNKDNNYHIDKTQYFLKQGISIIHIWEIDWDTKKDLWKSIILNKLKRNKYFVYARKCIIKEVTSEVAKSFLDENHLFGNRYAKINIGLYYEGELVSLLTFSRHRKYDWELIRYCNLKEHSVIGGFSKMLAYFRKNYKGSIFSYNDIDITPDYKHSIYFKNNFKFLGITRPSYFYTDGSNKFHRMKFSHNSLPKEAKDEYSYTNGLGLNRCFTAGNNRFLLE